MHYFFLFLLSLSTWKNIASSEEVESCIHDDTNFRCVEYVRNYDGDTVTVNIPDIHPLFGQKIGIRIKGIDTAEIRTDDACELFLAKRAKAYVAEVLQEARRIDLEEIKRGKYFRIVASLKFDGRDLGEELLQEGFAYRYDGGRKPEIDWCRLSEFKF